MSKLLIFPTDTVYGIGCPIFDLLNIQKIYELKHRAKEKPLACLCYDLSQIESIAETNSKIKKLIQTFLPGPLTLILPAKPKVVQTLGYQTIGVRIPNSITARNILKVYGPMLTTSVNESGESPLNSYEEICKQYGNCVDEIYPSSEPSSCLASTVVDCTTDTLHILREGSITLQQINKIWNV